ncbi:DUF5110 domain-containing protein [Pontibacillus yanchengensis]|uniref:DUF5110 domain-containing protein n=1 Tax=Pontibacillus yanchengensis TaxID=462910 RepID=UPI003C6E926D
MEWLAYYSSDKEMVGAVYEDDELSYDYRDGKYSLTKITVHKDGQIHVDNSGLLDTVVKTQVRIIGKGEAGE